MIEFDCQFESTVDIYDFGRMAYTVVHLPKKLSQESPIDDNPRLWIDGTIADIPLHGALQPAGDGRYYLNYPKPTEILRVLSRGI